MMKKMFFLLLTFVLTAGMILPNLTPAIADERNTDDDTANLVVVYSDKENSVDELGIDKSEIKNVTNLENGIDVIEVNVDNKEEVLEDVQENDNVDYAFFSDISISTMGGTLPNDPGLSGADYYYESIQADSTWNVTGEKNTVVAAVIDTGVEKSCSDLSGKVIEYKDMYAAAKSEEPCAAGDIAGHGTQVANVLAAIADNNIGTAGIAGASDVKIISYRCGGTAASAETIDAIALLQSLKDINDNHQEIQVVNMSFGFLNTTQSTQNFIDAIQEEIDKMAGRGVIICASSGNSGVSEKYYPACCDHVYSVGAVDDTLERTSFSTYNEDIDFVAPGQGIPTVDLSNTLVYPDGTSFASPSVAGAFSYLLSSTDATVSEIEEAMVDSAKDLGAAGKDNEYGNGLIQIADAYKALNTEASLTLDKSEISMVIGDNQSLTYTVVPEGSGVTWTSSDESIAIVDNTGKITAVAEGTATITAVSDEDKQATCNVTVYDHINVKITTTDTDPVVRKLEVYLYGYQSNIKALSKTSYKTVVTDSLDGNTTKLYESENEQSFSVDISNIDIGEHTFTITVMDKDSEAVEYEKDVKCTVLAQKAKYVVTFYPANGTDNFIVVVEEGSTVSKPESDPTYTGYTFKGWVKEGESELYDFSTPITSDLKLVAQYTTTNIPNTGISGNATIIYIACGIAAAAIVLLVIFIVKKRKNSKKSIEKTPEK